MSFLELRSGSKNTTANYSVASKEREITQIPISGTVYTAGLEGIVYQWYSDSLTPMNQSESVNAPIWTIRNDGEFIYVGSDPVGNFGYVYKYSPLDMSLCGQTTNLGNGVYGITFLGDYLYATAGSKVAKIRKADMYKVLESIQYGSNIGLLITDGTYIYAGDNATGKVYKLNAIDLSEVDEVVFGNVWALETDGNYIYVGGSAVGLNGGIYKYDLDLNKVGETDIFDGYVYGDIIVENGYLYAIDGAERIRKYDTSSMTQVATSELFPDNSAYNLTSDGTYLYTSYYDGSKFIVVKISKETLSIVGTSTTMRDSDMEVLTDLPSIMVSQEGDFIETSDWTQAAEDGFVILKGTGWAVSRKTGAGIYNTPFTCVKKATPVGTKIRTFAGGEFGIFPLGSDTTLPFKRQIGTVRNSYKAEDLYVLEGNGEVTISSGNLVDDRYIEDGDRNNSLMWNSYDSFYTEFYMGRRPGEVMQQYYWTGKYFYPNTYNGGYFRRTRTSSDADDTTYRYTSAYGSIQPIGTIGWIQGQTSYCTYPLYGWNCFSTIPTYSSLAYRIKNYLTYAELDPTDDSRIRHIKYPQVNRGFYLLPDEKYYPNKRITINGERPILLRLTDNIWQSNGTVVNPQPLKKNLWHYADDQDIICPTHTNNDYARCWNNSGYSYAYRTIYRRTKYTPETYNYTTQSVNPASTVREYFVVFSNDPGIPTINYSTYYSTTYIRRAYEYAARVYWFYNMDDRQNMPVQISNNSSRWYLDIQGKMTSTQYVDTEIVWTSKTGYTLASEQYVSSGFSGVTCKPILTYNPISYKYRLLALNNSPILPTSVSIVDSNLLKVSFSEAVEDISLNENESFSIKSDRISYAGNEQTLAYTLYDVANDSYNKSLLHFNGVNGSRVFTDVTAKIWTPTVSGVQILQPGANFSGGYLTTPDHSDWTLGTSNWTFDCWVKLDQTHPNGFNLFSSWLDSNNQLRIYYGGDGYSNKLSFLYILNGSYLNWAYSNMTFTPGTWYHVAVIRNGADLRIFINGVSQSLWTPEAPGSNYSHTYEGIGSLNLQNFAVSKMFGSGLTGNIDEYRFAVGVVRWWENFTPVIPFDPYIALGNYVIGSTYDFYHKINYFKVNDKDLYIYFCDGIDALRADKKLYITYDSTSGSLYTNKHRVESFTAEVDTTTQQQVVPSGIENITMTVTASCTLTWTPV